MLFDHDIKILVCSDFLVAPASISLASSSRALAWSTLGDVGEEGRVFSSGASCVLGIGGDVHGGLHSPGIEKQDPGQGRYFSVWPSSFQNPPTACMMQA